MWLASVGRRVKQVEDIDQELREIDEQESGVWLNQMKDLTLDASLLGVYQQGHELDARRDRSFSSSTTSSSSSLIQELRREEVLNKSWELQRLGESSSLVDNIRLHVS